MTLYSYRRHSRTLGGQIIAQCFPSIAPRHKGKLQRFHKSSASLFHSEWVFGTAIDMGLITFQICFGTSFNISQTIDLPIRKLNESDACDSPVARYLSVTANFNEGDKGSRKLLPFLTIDDPTKLKNSSQIFENN